MTSLPDPSLAGWVLGFSAMASGALLILGFLTPAAVSVAGLTTIAIVVARTAPSDSRLVMDEVGALLIAADAVALALLGPGAHSMDAYLFGRREIVITHDARRD